MTVASFTKFFPFVKAVAEKVHNLGTDTFFVQFLASAPAQTNAVETDLPADLTTGGGYTSGGFSVGTATSSAQSGGTYKLVIADYTFTATGAVGPFRYAVLLNNTATNKDLIGFFDYGSNVTMANTDTFLLDFDQVEGLLTLQ